MSGRQNICSESSVGNEVSWGIIANHHNKPSISPYLLSGSDLFGVLPNNLGEHEREKNEHELIPMEFIMASEAWSEYRVSLFPLKNMLLQCNWISYDKLTFKSILIGSHLWSIGGQVLRWRQHFAFYHIKKNRFQVTVAVYSNRSQKSFINCLMDISDTLSTAA